MFPHAHSMSTGDDTINEKPSFFHWDRMTKRPITFYTDHCIPQVVDDTWSERKIALLIEAPKFRPQHYVWATEYESHFDYILTYHRNLLEIHDPTKWLYYPHCGSWVLQHSWGVYPKAKLISFLASSKRSAEGHKYRIEVYDRFAERLECYGGITGGRHVGKSVALKDYCYSVIVAGERGRGFFSDHIIDCMAYGTIPIYWKKYDIGNYFDLDGIITFENLDELERVLNAISRVDYMNRMPAIERNLILARNYTSAEDWLWLNRKELFDGIA
jgi:hypothetical protein